MIKLISFLFLMVISTSSFSSNALIGNWSRFKTTCDKPELNFVEDSMTINLDGKPKSFNFKNAVYSVNKADIFVSLGKNHPYSKTPSEKSLTFIIKDNDTMSLKMVNNAELRFYRCK